MTIILYLLVIVFLLAFPAETSGAAMRAMRTWATSIVPTLFPYMVFGRLLGNSLHMLNLPAAPAAAALGLLGGSPTGAALIVSYAPGLSSRCLFSLCALTGTLSPMFILGTMLTWTNHEPLCSRLLLCHWISAVLSAWIVWVVYGKPKYQSLFSAETVQHAWGNPLSQSIDAIIQVGGCVILYSVLAQIGGLLLRPILPRMQPVFHAALEAAGGINAIWQSDLSVDAKGTMICIALGFSGFSILAQNHAMLKPLGIRMHQLIAFALLRACLSGLLFPFISFLVSIN